MLNHNQYFWNWTQLSCYYQMLAISDSGSTTADLGVKNYRIIKMLPKSSFGIIPLSHDAEIRLKKQVIICCQNWSWNQVIVKCDEFGLKNYSNIKMLPKAQESRHYQMLLDSESCHYQMLPILGWKITALSNVADFGLRNHSNIECCQFWA